MNGEDLRSACILIVDDEPVNVRVLDRMLAAAGYTELVSTTDPRQVLGLFRERQPDLVLLDLMMPYLDGFAVLEQLRAEIPAGAYLPVLILTADATTETRRRALDAGAHDFLTKPFEHFEALLRIRNLLQTRRLHVALEAHNRSLEETVRQRSAQLLQSEKVAAMGSLLAGVAHELNNPLSVLSGHAQLLTEDDIPGVGQRATQIQNAADRCVRIVRNFLALARQRPPERAATRLRAVIEGSLELLAYELRTDNVAVTTDVEAGLPVLWADAHQLHQVLVNLITNAHHAMRRQSAPRTLTISARHEPETARVRLAVADSGPGIPEAVRAQIFEPFYTTKPAGEGTGLGLSLCRGIIVEHGGTIAVDTELGRGTTFVIELPVVTPPPQAEAPSGAGAARPKPRKSYILVVDDEAAVADVVADALRRDGHRTEVASDGARALQILALAPFDLIVSDTKMPGMDGEGLYEEVGRRFPALRDRIVFVTGDVLSAEKRAFLERTGAPFLTKPCDLGELRRVVAAVLEERGPARGV
ncbi:MAG TPA: response regulator [Terriglobales bacterium]|nr:response regulator [Terriglobales bacterium]